jgi:hypothetical protein
MVRLGILRPSLPVYVFSEEASDQVSQLIVDYGQARLAEVAPFPHDQFAIEMWCKTEAPQLEGERMRSLTVVYRAGSMPFYDEIKHGPAGARHYLLEVESLGGSTVIYPIMYCNGPGTTLVPVEDSTILEVTKESYAMFWPEIMRNPALARKYDVRMFTKEIVQKDPSLYGNRANEATTFLTAACAALASPVAGRTSAVSVGRARGERKGQERRVEIKWTHVDIDLDRTTKETARGEGDGRHGVALHPVRAHLRMTKHGVFGVRAHMRGDAAFGVRHRVGRVHKGKAAP